jgi:hypothetical protein
MTAHKYNYEVTDIDALEAFAKNAVVVRKSPVRGMITKMLDAGVTVPGVKIIEWHAGEPVKQQYTAEQDAKNAEASGFMEKVRTKQKAV